MAVCMRGCGNTRPVDLSGSIDPQDDHITCRSEHARSYRGRSEADRSQKTVPYRWLGKEDS